MSISSASSINSTASDILQQSFLEAATLLQETEQSSRLNPRRVTGTTRQSMTTPTTISIGEITVQKSSTKQTVSTTEQILFHKEERERD